MSKFCTKCGKEMDDNANVCSNCGTPFNGAINNQEINNYYNYTDNSYVNNNVAHIEKREILTCILLLIITCGIYGIYWFICLTNDSNSISKNEKTADGGLAFVYTLLTCGIYALYWYYKLGKKIYEAGKINNIEVSDNFYYI